MLIIVFSLEKLFTKMPIYVIIINIRETFKIHRGQI